MKINAEILGAANIQKKIIKVIVGLSDWKEPLKWAENYLKDEYKENFDKQGAIYQGGGFANSAGRVSTTKKAWRPLSQSTRVQRKRLGFGGARPILVRTGKLKNKGFAIVRRKVDGFDAINTIKYAKYHQLGTKRMPQRKIMGVSRKATLGFKQAILNKIKKELKIFSNTLGVKTFSQ